MPHNSHAYEFGPYRFDVAQRVLTRTGETISLTPKATDILTLLVTNAGQLVAKDELLKQVWPDTFVEENNLTQNIFLLRRVLGDERPAPKYIETVVRRGYRFVANVRIVSDLDSGDRSAINADVRSQSANADDASAPRSVAVLPFVNATGNHDIEYLAEGLTENIVNNLSRVTKLRVMSRSAVFRYRVKKELDPRVVGRELGVGAVLVGRLTARAHVVGVGGSHAAGDGVGSTGDERAGVVPGRDIAEVKGSPDIRASEKSQRTAFEQSQGPPFEQSSGLAGVEKPQALGISVELVEVASGWQLWGDSFDCRRHDLLEIQDLITRHLLTALKLNLSGDEEKRITARYTESAEAYQSYLEARYHWSKYTRKGIEKAILHFRQAIELDPNYALAYAGIIDCYLRLATNYLPPETDSDQRKDEAHPQKTPQIPNKATKLDDSDPKVKLRFQWDWKAAERELHRATELKIDYPSAHQWYAAYRLVKDVFKESATFDAPAQKQCGLPGQVVLGAPTVAEQLQVLCAIAREQIAVGNFDAAEILLRAWYCEKLWPNLEALTPHAAADLLYTLGLLVGSLAGTKRIINGNRHGEAFLSGSIALFKNLGIESRSAEGLVMLARCYYQEGQFDIARKSFSAALSELPDDEREMKCLCLIYSGALERAAGRLIESLLNLRQAAMLDVAGLSIWGRLHLELATTLKDLAVDEPRQSYNDEAQFHYRTALYESEAIGNHRMVAIAENNLGFLLLNLGFTDESEKRLLRARLYFEALADSLRQAQVNETLTRLYVTRKQYSAAQHTIEAAIQMLEATDAEAVLSEAMTTGGIVACKLERFGEAQKRFESACKIAERCGDREGERRALVSMFDEIGTRLNDDELYRVLEKLKKLRSIIEPSPLGHKVEQTIARIEAIIDKSDSGLGE